MTTVYKTSARFQSYFSRRLFLSTVSQQSRLQSRLCCTAVPMATLWFC